MATLRIMSSSISALGLSDDNCFQHKSIMLYICGGQMRGLAILTPRRMLFNTTSFEHDEKGISAYEKISEGKGRTMVREVRWRERERERERDR